MKISRTSSPVQPGSPGKAPSIGGAGGKGFAAKLSAATSSGVAKGTEATGKAQEASRPGPMTDIGAALKAGKLTPQAAIDKVIERILDRQVGRKASAAVREKVGAALRESLSDDPMLAAKVRALGEE